MNLLLPALWRYRHFIVTSVRNDLRTRFARSRLGATWMIVQPLAQGAIYALVLSRVLGSRLPGVDNRYAYVIYLLSGLLGWTLFADTLTRCLTVFVDRAVLMQKMAFPRACLPLIVAGSTLVNNAFLLLATALIFIAMGHPPEWMWLWLVPLTGVTLLFALGLGLILGILNVFVRDVAQVMGVVLQLWFWVTPVVYYVGILPGGFASLLRFNPLYALCASYQQVLLWGRPPHWHSVTAVGVLAVLLLAAALGLFRRAAPDMADVL